MTSVSASSSPVGEAEAPGELDVTSALKAPDATGGVQPGAVPLRVLVAIASYGEKNLTFLRQIIRNYQSMPFQVDLVVLSEAPKDLGAGVEVIVGLPSKNPWTLPFAHKAVFAERLERYDLFVYSEDDIHVSESHVRAFLDATARLHDEEIAGFIRYEVDASGNRFVNEPWQHYHWKPDSVRQRGDHTIAEFTNEHTGLYILTQKQLRRAIASGGFLRGPCTGRYSWPETAATDPYTNCGFRKVICISALERFLVHHLPNPYVAHLDVSLPAFQEQIQTLQRIRDAAHPAHTLFEVESKLWPAAWQKSYYEKPGAELLGLVPQDAREILSVGCGWGGTEDALQQRGAKVTALPLDSVIGAVAERRRIEVVYGDWNECMEQLDGCQFDCVVMTNLIHLQPNPERLVEFCLRAIHRGGALVVGGPNFDRLPCRVRGLLGIGGYGNLRRFDRSGFHCIGPGTLARQIVPAGFRVTDVRWLDHGLQRGGLRGRELQLGSLTAREWLLRARRQGGDLANGILGASRRTGPV